MASYRYRVFIKEGAVSELRGIPFPFRRQINQRIADLKRRPCPEGAARIEGDRFRWIVAGFRILYEVDDETATVTVHAIVR